MVQLWQEPDPEQEAVTLVPEGEVPDGWRHVFDGIDGHDRPISLVHEDTEPLRRMAVFDVVVNNADRKGGHVLEMTDGHRYGVDHGVTFHVEHKLRTVLWGWAGRAADRRRGRRSLADLRRRGLLAGDLGERARRAPHRPRDRRRWPAAARRLAGPRRCCRRRAASYPAIPWPPF